MKPLFLILVIAVLFVTVNAGAATICSCEAANCSFPGLTPYQSEYINRGRQADGCSCPAGCEGSMYESSDCRTGGSINVPG